MSSRKQLRAAKGRRKSRGSSVGGGARLSRDIIIEQVMMQLETMPDPDAILRENNISRGELAKLENDTEISSALETRLDAVLSTPWRLESETRGEPLQWLHDQLEKHMEQFLTGVWSAVPYGFSVLELVWEPPAPRRGIARMAKKPVDWFGFGRTGELQWNNPLTGQLETIDTRYKLIVTKRKADWENPYGRAMLSRLYWPFYFRHNLWRLWMQFLDRFGDPLLVGKGDEPQEMADRLLALGFESVATVGIDDDIKAVLATGTGEFERADRSLSQQIAKVILGQTLTSSVDGKGSYAAAKVHNEVRQDKRNSDLRLCTKAAQQLVDWLWELNELPGQAPKFVMEDNVGLELDRAERDKALMDAGLTLSEDYFLRAYDFDDGEISVPNQEPPAAGKGKKLSLAASASDPFTPEQMEVERAIDAVLRDLPDPMPADLVRQAVMAATDPDDLEARLMVILDGGDSAFAETVARAQFAAQLLGYVQEAG